MSKKSREKSNIETINSFFSSRFVLATGIISIVGYLLHSLSSTATTIFQMITDTYSGSSKSFNFSDATSSSMITGVLFILMYIFAKRNSESIKVPIKIYSVYTYVQLILSAIGCCIIPFVLIIVSITGDFRFSFFGLPKALCLLIVLFLIISLLLFMLMVTYIERRYAKSLNESVTTPTLCKEGAEEYSVLCFIFAGIAFAMYFILSIYMATETNHIFPFITTSVSSLNTVSLLFCGILANRYAEFIPDEEEIEPYEEPYELTYPNIKTDTTETINPKYIQEIEVTNKYKEDFYE